MSSAEAAGIRLPKLPELDKDDVKAVRTFLPGKLLGRTAALLSLVLLVLGFAILVDQSLKQFLDTSLPMSAWQHFGLLLGLPTLVVAAQVGIEWQAGRARRALQFFAVQSAAVPQGYFHIGPYQDTPEDQAKFTRSDQAHFKVLDWIKQSTSIPLYLTGDSGSGKSSLLNAFVVPILRKEGWIVVEARAWQDPQAALHDALAHLDGTRRPRPGEGQNLRDLVERVARRARVGLLLVLDQFEEFVILGKSDQQESFAALLGLLHSASLKKLRLLLALRSEYQTLLADFGMPLLRYGENFYQVRRFTLGAAGGFMAGSDLGLQPNALVRLLKSAAEMDETPGLIRPITLNVLGYVLVSGGSGSAPSLDAGQLVRLYIEQTLSQPAVRDCAVAVLEMLVTEQNTKQPRSEQEMVAATGLRRGEVRGVLNALSAAALARPLDAEQGVWELSHDFVARAIARHLGRKRPRLRNGAYYTAPALLILTLLIAGFTISNPSEVQSGYWSGGYSSNPDWLLNKPVSPEVVNYVQTYRLHVVFEHQYETLPKVVVIINTVNAEKDAKYSVTANDVTRFGFDIAISRFGGGVINDLGGSWIAFEPRSPISRLLH